MAQDLLFIDSIETKKQELYGVRKETRMMKKAVIVSACRTAIGAFGGTLKDVPAAELGAIVVKEAVSRAGIKPEQVDEVIFGNECGTVCHSKCTLGCENEQYKNDRCDG